jgi:hypothetical protein
MLVSVAAHCLAGHDNRLAPINLDVNDVEFRMSFICYTGMEANADFDLNSEDSLLYFIAVTELYQDDAKRKQSLQRGDDVLWSFLDWLRLSTRFFSVCHATSKAPTGDYFGSTYKTCDN